MSASTFLSISVLQFIAAYVVVVMIPGPVTFATGGPALLRGFAKILPLLAGIGVGRAALTTVMAFGAVHLATIYHCPPRGFALRRCCAEWAWRIVARATPPTIDHSSKRLEGDLFAKGVLVGFLSPQTVAFSVAALVSLMLETPELVVGLSLVAIATAITVVGWHAVVAALFSRPFMCDAAFRHYHAICRTAATTLCVVALYSVLPTIGA